ncbi:MAG: copper resistance protein NlpE [Gracilimonas sp.]|uniref:copper resistance protein NlpE n=1 Tax=Gracilimonas sp. TaxID=1974203 RepID=UPI003753C87E|nr:copper resistance protein NlpE [Gracilimonas sp.]
MKTQYILFALLPVIFLSCTSKQGNSSKTETISVLPDSHISQNSLDWQGTYSGVIPCASCEGIDTSLEINEDLTYQLTMIYLGEDGSNKVERSGNFSWNEAGDIITLDNEDKPSQYFVGENYIAMLDMDGNRVTGDLADHYILRKE